eukprot:6860923-Prymnesium_polylepis.2
MAREPSNRSGEFTEGHVPLIPSVPSALSWYHSLSIAHPLHLQHCNAIAHPLCPLASSVRPPTMCEPRRRTGTEPSAIPNRLPWTPHHTHIPLAKL